MKKTIKILIIIIILRKCTFSPYILTFFPFWSIHFNFTTLSIPAKSLSKNFIPAKSLSKNLWCTISIPAKSLSKNFIKILTLNK